MVVWQSIKNGWNKETGKILRIKIWMNCKEKEETVITFFSSTHVNQMMLYEEGVKEEVSKAYKDKNL